MSIFLYLCIFAMESESSPGPVGALTVKASGYFSIGCELTIIHSSSCFNTGGRLAFQNVLESLAKLKKMALFSFDLFSHVDFEASPIKSLT